MKTYNLLNLALLLGLLVGSVPNRTLAQNCGCAPGYCCSNHGYCGTTPDYCGQGNCKENCPSNNNDVTVSTVVTPEFFDAILAQSGQTSCPGNGFYTRDNFLEAANQFPQFGTSGASDDSLREIAAFFAHVTHETGHMCYIEERPNPPGSELPTFCKSSNTQYPCNPNKKYYGRGPLQLTWNYNYGLAGDALKFDGLNYPETLATDALFSFKASVWFWMTNVHSTIVSGQGFGATIRAINSNECDARDPQTVESRVNYYLDYCKKFGVSPGNNLSC